MSAASFLAAAGRTIGADHVIADPQGLAPFAQIMLPLPEAEHAPAGVVSPQSVDEVQALLRLAHDHKAYLWPTSTGRNFGYGTSTCATPGQVVLDLRRMNRILDVDPELCTALVEPGVTYRNIGIQLKITSRFADIERIVAEALGEVPVTEDAPRETSAPSAEQQPAQTSPAPTTGRKP